MKKQPLLVPLTPQNLDDVYNTAIIIASTLGEEEKAYEYLTGLKKKTAAILDRLRQQQMPMKRVSLLEWIEPIYNCGHWIPFQIAQAGGIDMLSNPSGDSIVTSWEKILKYNPEVMVIAPCGFETKRANQEVHLLTQKPGWSQLKAVQTKQVYLADYDLFTQPSASTLVDGIELLAALFHPQLFEVPMRLGNKFFSFYKTVAHVHA